MRHPSRPVLLALALIVCVIAEPARANSLVSLAPVDVLAAGFGDLAGVAAHATGHVFVTDRRMGTVVRIAPDHAVDIVATGLAQPVGVAFDGQGRLLVVEEHGGRVVRLEPDGRRTTIITGVRAPRWIAADDSGTVYISAHRLKNSGSPGSDDDAVDPEVILAWNPSRGLRVFADDFRQLEGIVVSDGAVHALASGRRSDREATGGIYRMMILPDGNAGPAMRVAITHPFARPIGIARDRLGALYVTARRFDAEQDAAARVVLKAAGDGTATLFASGLGEPSGLAFDPDGHLYAADGAAGRILRFRAPPAATLDALPEFTRQPTVIVAGLAEPGAEVALSTGDLAMAARAAETGRFGIEVPLLVEARTTIDVAVTAHAGSGLASVASHASIVHDSVAPSAAFVTPAAGPFVRGTVAVHAHGADAGSGVATLILARGGHDLGAAVVPRLPAPTASATVAWDTAVVTDGAHTLSITASDRAGNTTMAERSVLVDNTPPDTLVIAGPAGTISETAVAFEVTGIDTLSPASGLSFSWRLDGGAWSAFTASTTIALSGLTQGPHRFEVRARDQAGNEDPTPAARDFAVGGVGVSSTAPLDGATVPAGIVIVRGAIEGATSHTGVLVNGVVASVTGARFTAAVRVDAGVNAIVAVGAASGEPAASASVTIVATPIAGAGMLHVTPRAGFAPLTAAFTLFGVPDDAEVSLDLNGDGLPEFAGARLDRETFVFTTPGLYVATAVVTETDGTRRHSQAVVDVVDRSTLDALLQARWSGMKDALRSGDIARALSFVVERRQADYDAALRLLHSELPVIDTILTDIFPVDVRAASAIYEMTRVDGGVLKSFEIRFAVENDGVWRLEAF